MNTAIAGLAVLTSQGVYLTASDLMWGLVVAFSILLLLFAFSITGSVLEKKEKHNDTH